jgi:hypothetical protein
MLKDMGQMYNEITFKYAAHLHIIASFIQIEWLTHPSPKVDISRVWTLQAFHDAESCSFYLFATSGWHISMYCLRGQNTPLLLKIIFALASQQTFMACTNWPKSRYAPTAPSDSLSCPENVECCRPKLNWDRIWSDVPMNPHGLSIMLKLRANIWLFRTLDSSFSGRTARQTKLSLF